MRLPPHDAQAEQVLLAAILNVPHHLDALLELPTEAFYLTPHRATFEAMKWLHSEGRQVDPTSIKTYLIERGRGGEVKAEDLLEYLLFPATTPRAVMEHAATVRERYRQRKFIELATQYSSKLYQPTHKLQELFDAYAAELSDVLHLTPEAHLAPIGQVYDQALSDMQATKAGTLGLRTRWRDFDDKIGAFMPGDLVIIAGRPGMGKTSFAQSILLNIAEPQLSVAGDASAFFSLEMPKHQVAIRAGCGLAKVDVQRALHGRLDSKDLAKLELKSRELWRYPIFIDDSSNISTAEIRARIRRLKNDLRAGVHDSPGLQVRTLKAVCIDYLQLMRGVRAKNDTREREVANICKDLKAIAKDEQLVVFALSQLNRNVEKTRGGDKRPELSDLRESGAIEQDADTIIFLYREGYYDREATDASSTEVILAKRRNGPTGTVHMHFDAPSTRFYQRAPAPGFTDLDVDDLYDPFENELNMPSDDP